MRELDTRIGEIEHQTEDQAETFNDWSTNFNERTLELQNRADQAQQQIDELRQGIATSTTAEVQTAAAIAPVAAPAISDEHVQKIAAHESTMVTIQKQIAAIDGRTLDMQQAFTASKEQLDATTERSTDLDDRTLSLENRSKALEAQTVLALEQLHEIRNAPSTTMPEGLDQQVEALEATVAELQQELNETQAQNPSQSTEEMRDILVYRLDNAEERIDRRLTNLEQSTSDSGQIEAMQRAIEDANAQSREALAFSENLRLLQTDLVQALRKEIAGQAQLIQRNEGTIARLEAQLSNRD